MSSTTTYTRLTEFPRAFCDHGLANRPARISDGKDVAKEAIFVIKEGDFKAQELANKEYAFGKMAQRSPVSFDEVATAVVTKSS